MKFSIKLILKITVVVYTLNGLYGCKKYLDEKPDQKLATIETLGDMQALLDFNAKININDPGVANAVSDDSYVTDDVFNARNEYERNLYLWKGSNTFTTADGQWLAPYELIYISNTILDAAERNEKIISNRQELNHIRAQALFHRGRSFLNITGVWTNAYDPLAASNEMGVPLRLDVDFNKISTRASMAETYDRILVDLKAAAGNLPVQAVSPVRASKAAAYGMLSRVYLQMRQYNEAKLYADSALRIQSTLLDYNTLSANANFPIARHNAEVIFDSRAAPVATSSQARALINPELYNLYETNDLRKTIFFRASGNAFIFKGYYAGAASPFNGIATDELLLTRAECLARSGQLADALKDINLLLTNRYKKGTFQPYLDKSQAELLTLIKVERRKELAFRTLRWQDIKRWNKEGEGIILKRTTNGQQTILQPNSLLYALPIPEDVIGMTGMPQNAR